jgi:hypothetical protein
MKKLALIFMLFMSVSGYGQVNETFSDGDFTNNPTWTGTTSNFLVNSNGQLQSKATTTSISSLFTPSEAFDDASWECWVKMNLNPSSNNNMSVYIVSDLADITNGCYGYFVQIGGSPDEVSLFVQKGTKKRASLVELITGPIPVR